MWKNALKIITTVLALGSIVGGYIFIDDRLNEKFALADSLKQTNIRVEQHILMDRAWYVQKQMQSIEYQCSTNNPNKMPKFARDRYLDFKIELNMLELKIQKLTSGKN